MFLRAARHSQRRLCRVGGKKKPGRSKTPRLAQKKAPSLPIGLRLSPRSPGVDLPLLARSRACVHTRRGAPTVLAASKAAAYVASFRARPQRKGGKTRQESLVASARPLVSTHVCARTREFLAFARRKSECGPARAVRSSASDSTPAIDQRRTRRSPHRAKRLDVGNA